MRVVLDTNAWLLPFSDGTDLESELTTLFGAHERIVPRPVLGELETLAEGRGSTARHAGMALRLAAGARVEPSDLPGDDSVLDVATRLRAAVVSNDRLLQAEAKRRGLPVVASRETGRLSLR